MARKKVSPEEHREIQRVREIKKKAEKRQPGPVDEDKGDDLCAICDNGGDLVCCDGICQRCFHVKETKCRLILGLSEDQAKMISDDKNREFVCKNCKYNQHQCFACGKLGSSDLSSGAEVFQCELDNCGKFYHPKCVAELLYPDSETGAEHFTIQVAASQGFKCPVHECSVCKGGENKNDYNLQFAICLRCPTVYHRKCLPSDIRTEPGPNGEMQRAWDTMQTPDGQDIRHNRILIYCTKHEIVKKLGTPKMNHIVFPKRIREPKTVAGPLVEEGIPSNEQLLDQPSPELSQPPSGTRDQNRCTCSCSHDSFAPSYLFPHPHPGSGGWLED